MTKDQLLITIENYNRGLISFDVVETAVDAYCTALIAAKPLVRGQSEHFFCWDEEALGTESRCKAECEICKNKGEQKNCPARHFKAKITRWIYSHEEDFDEAEVSSFDEALEMCKYVGSLGGLIGQCVEFTKIDKENMTAEFKVNSRMRYEGDSFSLSVTPCT